MGIVIRCGGCEKPITEEQARAMYRLEPQHTVCLTSRFSGIRRIDDLIATETKAALEVFSGDKEAAAKALGISVRTIYRKMKNLNGGPN